MDEEECKLRFPSAKDVKEGGFFNHRQTPGNDMPPVILPPTGWEEHPPLLHIFDLALDEVYVNMVAQDYPNFRIWDQHVRRVSRSANMANLILRGEMWRDSISTVSQLAPRHARTRQQEKEPDVEQQQTKEPPCCGCIVA
jgi:hypothetical protein